MNPQRHLVITVHGIRTFGQWQERLERLVQSREPSIKVYNYHYGYYSILAYIFPPLRWLMTVRFRRALIKEAERAQWDSIDIVAHSFGTHLAAWGLYGIPSEKRPKIRTFIFAASVLKPNFPWSELISTCVGRLVNDCGDRDNVLLFNQIAILFTGRAGQVGFNGMTNDQFRNRFFNFDHSGYFMKEGKVYDDFMRNKWLPLLTRDEPAELFDERMPPSAIRGFLIFLANNATPIKLTTYLIILAIPAVVYFRLYLIADEQRRIAQSQLLAFQAGKYLGDKVDLALLLSVEASRRHHTEAASHSLLVTLLHYPHLASFLHGHTEELSTVAFSPDGKILASAGRDDGTIRLWDLQTRSPINQPLTARGDGKAMDYVHSVAFSPDGKVLASSGIDGSKSVVRLWDVATGQARGQLLSDKDRGAGWNLAFSPQGNVLASVIGGTIRLWDVETGKPLGQPYTSSNGLASAISQNGKILAVGAGDGAIQLWDVATGQARGQPFRDRSGPYSMAFSPDGKILASGSGSGDGPIQLWDVATGQARGQPFRHRGSVFSMVFSPDGKILASGSGPGTIQLWDVATGRTIGESLIAYSGGKGMNHVVRSLAFSPEGRVLASGGADGVIRLWDFAIRHSLAGLPLTGHSDTVYSVSFSPDGKVLASGGGRDGSIRLWDVRTHSAMGPPLKGHTGVDPYVRSVAFSPDGRLLASGGNDGTIRLWDMATRQSLGLPIMTGHSTAVYSVAFSPDGKVLASSGIDGFDRSSGFDNYTIRLWDVATRQPLGLIRTDSLSQTIVFSPDGKVLASSLGGGAMGNTTIQLWKVATQQVLGRPFTGDGESVTTMIFSPDGRLLASGGRDGTIRLWKVATQQALGQPFIGGGGPVVRLAFNGEGKIIALVNGRLWNVTNSQPMTTLFLIVSDLAFKAANSSSVAFSPDTRLLASGETDGTIRLWDINIRSWEALACRIANRNLTEEEWKQYIGNNERHKDTCLKTK